MNSRYGTFAVRHAEEERERKHHGEQHGPLRQAARQIEPRQVVQDDHREDEADPRDADRRDVEDGVVPLEEAADQADQHRVHGEIRDVAAPARRGRVAAPGDALEVAAVEARERVPERARRAEHGELLALIEREREVGAQREARGHEAERERSRRDPQPDAAIVRVHRRRHGWLLRIPESTAGRVRMQHASFRIRMPRLRPSLRVPHARRAVSGVPVLQGRGAAEADVGLRRAVEHAGQVVGRMGSTDERLRIVRRPARAWRLQHELIGRLTPSRSVPHFTRAFRHRNYQLFFGGQLDLAHRHLDAVGRRVVARLPPHRLRGAARRHRRSRPWFPSSSSRRSAASSPTASTGAASSSSRRRCR